MQKLCPVPSAVLSAANWLHATLLRPGSVQKFSHCANSCDHRTCPRRRPAALVLLRDTTSCKLKVHAALISESARNASHRLNVPFRAWAEYLNQTRSPLARLRSVSLGRVRVRSGVNIRHQIRRLEPKCLRQAADRLQPHRPLTPLDQADMRPMQPRGVRQGLLGHPPVLPPLADEFPRILSESLGSHLQTIQDCRQWVIRRITRGAKANRGNRNGPSASCRDH